MRLQSDGQPLTQVLSCALEASLYLRPATVLPNPHTDTHYPTTQERVLDHVIHHACLEFPAGMDAGAALCADIGLIKYCHAIRD